MCVFESGFLRLTRYAVVFGLSIFGCVAAAQECASNVTTTPYSCDANADQESIYANQANQQLTINNTATAVLNIDPNVVTAPSTRNGIRVSTSGNTTLNVSGNVAITANNGYNDTDGVWVEPLDTPAGTVIDEININLGSQVVITPSADQYDDGVVAAAATFPMFTGGNININSDATISTSGSQSTGITAKLSSGQINIDAGGQISTTGVDSPAILSSLLGVADSLVNIKSGTVINTANVRSVGVLYNGSAYGAANPASAKNSEINLAAGANITTAGDEAHGVAAGGGASATAYNRVTLNNAIISVSGADANGILLETLDSTDYGHQTATVNVNNGSTITAGSGSGAGVRFEESNDTANPGTSGFVNLRGASTIDGSISGNAIFTARGTDIVTIYDDSRVKGMVDGGDDYAAPDTWIDELVFDAYSSDAQYTYDGQLVVYQNFEYVKLQNNTHIDFRDNYSTPPSVSYEIDATSVLDLTDDGSSFNTYTINANLGGNGTINTDINTSTGEADLLVVNGDTSTASTTGPLQISINNLGTDGIAMQIRLVEVVGGTTVDGDFVLTAPVSINGIDYEFRRIGQEWWLIRATPNTPVAVPAVSQLSLLLLIALLVMMTWRKRLLTS